MQLIIIFLKNHVYVLDKAFIDIDNWKKMKHKEITEAEKSVLKYIYEQIK